METLDLLWGHLQGGQSDQEFSAWAQHWLIRGHDTQEIVRLAGTAYPDTETRNQLFRTALAQIGHPTFQTRDQLLEIIELEMLKKYRMGEISGSDLVETCLGLWRKSGYSSRFCLWEHLSSDLALLEEEDRTNFFNLNPQDIEDSLRAILEKERPTSAA